MDQKHWNKQRRPPGELISLAGKVGRNPEPGRRQAKTIRESPLRLGNQHVGAPNFEVH